MGTEREADEIEKSVVDIPPSPTKNILWVNRVDLGQYYSWQADFIPWDKIINLGIMRAVGAHFRPLQTEGLLRSNSEATRIEKEADMNADNTTDNVPDRQGQD